MRKKQIVRIICLVFLSAIIVTPSNMLGSQEVSTPIQDRFSQEELDQMLAPIALYPDSLLSQMLMAATYPLEIVESARWLGKNPDLKGELLDQALKEKYWDVSVKSLAHFPQVLAMMDENIEWTTRIGDAFLAQKDDVMDTIQELRAKAEAAGNLRSTQEQEVAVESGVVTIEPAYPGVIYVPAYDPFWVYGPWWYPAYPPFVFYYPGVVITNGFFGFPFGFATGFGFGWSDWDWHHHEIYIHHDRVRHFHRFEPHHRFYGRERWEHNPEHRRGVAYWDRTTSYRFGQSPERSIQNRREMHRYADGIPNRQNMVNSNRQEINQRDFHSRKEVRGNEFRFREMSERNDRVLRERNKVNGFSSTYGIQRRQHEESGLGFRQGVTRQRSSVFNGRSDEKNTRIVNDQGRFSRENRATFRSGGEFRRENGGGLSVGGGLSSSGGHAYNRSGSAYGSSGGFHGGGGGFLGNGNGNFHGSGSSSHGRSLGSYGGGSHGSGGFHGGGGGLFGGGVRGR
ncbi:MAG TPA: DUF3300 domain-containing protein [Thermodesulfobacteriota bacterium]|nr:DUF3300 domain-containing protein [Thermodesulfobacteriota bacterium]